MNECQMALGLLGIFGLVEILLVTWIAYRLGQRDQKRKDEWNYTTYIH